MLGALLQQASILKRAVVIQDNRLKDYQDMVQERSQFKEIVDKYQQQIKALEVCKTRYLQLIASDCLICYSLAYTNGGLLSRFGSKTERQE